MPYSKLTWENNVTPLNAANLNRMEQGIADAHAALNDIRDLDLEVQSLNTNVNNLAAKVNNTLTASFDSSTGTLKFTRVTIS